MVVDPIPRNKFVTSVLRMCLVQKGKKYLLLENVIIMFAMFAQLD